MILSQQIPNFGLESPDEGPVQDLLLVVEGGRLDVLPLRRLLLLPLVVEELGDAEHQPVEGALVADLHLALVRVALALVLAAHVTTKTLSILEDLVADGADVLLGI